jgi:hypothetical protein
VGWNNLKVSKHNGVVSRSDRSVSRHNGFVESDNSIVGGNNAKESRRDRIVGSDNATLLGHFQETNYPIDSEFPVGAHGNAPLRAVHPFLIRGAIVPSVMRHYSDRATKKR